MFCLCKAPNYSSCFSFHDKWDHGTAFNIVSRVIVSVTCIYNFLLSHTSNDLGVADIYNNGTPGNICVNMVRVRFGSLWLFLELGVRPR